MQLGKLLTIVALSVSIGTGCAAMANDIRYDKAALRKAPDSYFDSRSIAGFSRYEMAEYMRRENAEQQELDREAACIFGSHAALSRKALKCYNVKGSPEYKAAQAKKQQSN